MKGRTPASLGARAARPRTASGRTSDSPWLATDVTRLAWLLAMGMIANTIAWYASSGSTDWSTQMGWLMVSIAAATLGGWGCVRWVTAGMRSTRWERARIVRILSTAQSRQRQPNREVPVHDGSDVVVVGPKMTHFHRPACQLAAGKDVLALTRIEIRNPNLTPCEMCTP